MKGNSIAYGLNIKFGSYEWNLSLLGVVLGFPGTDPRSSQKGSSTGYLERDGYLPNRLGSSMCGVENWGLMDQPREQAPHKLSRATGSIPCRVSLCKGQDGFGDSGLSGQHDYGGIHHTSIT